MKFSATVTKKDIALPLQVAWDFRVSRWLVIVHFLMFAFQVVHTYAPKVIEVPPAPVVAEPEFIKPTKAYADQRQKAKRNRRRKPSRKMRNLYQLA